MSECSLNSKSKRPEVPLKRRIITNKGKPHNKTENSSMSEEQFWTILDRQFPSNNEMEMSDNSKNSETKQDSPKKDGLLRRTRRTRGTIPKNTTNISSSGISDISQANDLTPTTANDLADITGIANTVNESPEKKLLRRNTRSNAVIVNSTHYNKHSELVNSLSDQHTGQSRSSDASKRNESNTRGNEQHKETSTQEKYPHYSSNSSKIAKDSQNISSLEPQLKQNQTAPSNKASYNDHAGEGYESDNSAGQIEKQEISKMPNDFAQVERGLERSKSSADNSRGHDRSLIKSRPSPNSTTNSNSKSIRQSISRSRNPQNTYVIEAENQQQEYIAPENDNHNQASPISVYKTPLSTTTLQNSKVNCCYH